MNVWFCSDLHLGHRKIADFRAPLVDSVEDNTNKIVADWKKLVTKRDCVYVLGDAVFDAELLPLFAELPGLKYLVRGNHDVFPTEEYLKYFKEVYGIFKYKEFWLSHAPVHPDELRGKVNLHGHVHFETIKINNPLGFSLLGNSKVVDRRYLNCCPENLIPTFGQSLVCLQDVRNHLKGA